MMHISGYSDVERIGQGGLGDVYRARHDATGATVAIKLLRDVSDESVAWHRTRRELTALVSLAGHAHVVRLIEVVELDEGPGIVMEFAPGGSVADLMIRRDEPLPVADAVLIGRHTAAALVAAHGQGIVHRDVKPQNLLIDAHGQVKLCDFGIAAMARSEEFRERTSALSMRYASPEELDEREVGPPTDVYSLGATLLHAARGAPPTLRERLAPWVPPSADDDDMAALDAVVAACLHPSPDSRPTAAEVLADLERVGSAIDDRHRALVLQPLDQRVDGSAILTTIGDATVIRRASEPAFDMTPPADVTAHREPAVARPTTQGRRRGPILVGSSALVIAAVMIGWLLSRGDDHRQADAVPSIGDEIVLVPHREGLEPLDALVWPVGPVGECLVRTAGVLTQVDCDEPHDLQRIAAGELDAATFPRDIDFDAGVVRDSVASICDLVFERFVGVPSAHSRLLAPFTAPSLDTFMAGDRSYQCWVGMPGQRMVGDVSARGA